MNLAERRSTGRAGLDLPVLGLGCAAFGGLYKAASASEVLAALDHAWQAGIRYYDAAPMYGLGRAEHLLGHFLREGVADRDGVRVSTKVGRLMARSRPGRDLPPDAPKNPLDPGWSNGLNFHEVFDYSYDGVMRSFDDSQQRTGLAEIDILYVHDIGRLTHGERHDHHWKALISGGFKALRELRSARLIKGFGLGVNETAVLADAMNETDLDCCLLAGRYTLLDRSGADVLEKARAAHVTIVIGGVFNSGILAAGASGQRKFDYMDPPEAIVGKVAQLSDICARYDVPLGAAALQFPLHNRAVTSVLVGARNPADVDDSVAWFQRDIPTELWSELEAVA